MDKKVAVITGGARGIGLEIAHALSHSSAIHVVLVDVLENELKEAKQQLSKDNKKCSIYSIDLKREEQVRELFLEVENKLGSVDILINNAAISPKKEGHRLPTHEISLEEWEEVFKVNMTGAFLCTKYALPHMVRKKWGRIINISSLAGRTASKIAGSHYAATKSGLIGFSRTVAHEYAGYGITVNNIAPGRIETPMAVGATELTNTRFLENIPMRRVGLPKDVASAAKFLCSEEAGYITGATLDVNGGIFMN